MLEMNIEEELEKLKLIEQRIKKILEDAVEGSLVVSNQKGSIVYIWVHGQKREYLNKSKKNEIRKLEEKNYYKLLLETVKRNQILLNRTRVLLDKVEDYGGVFLKIPLQKRHLIEPYRFVKDEKTIRRFQVPSGKGRVKSSHFVTLNRENVRSKSEVIIADRLKNAGVLYTYEPPTMIDEDSLELWHPDFLCLNSRTGKTYYWEHFGILDNSEYRQGFFHKIERYAEVGIFVGKKLIISMESSEYPLSTEHVDRLIKEYLL